MVTAHEIRNIIGIIGNVISLGLFLSPVPTFYKIYKKKDTEQFKADPYLATVLNCALWILYGLPFVNTNSFLVLTINGTGFVIESIFLIIYFIYASKKQRTKVIVVLLIEAVFMALVVSLVLSLAHTHKLRTLIVGILCLIFNMGMYFSPLTVARSVIRTKSVKYMPFYLSLANFLNGICWTIYGAIEFDYNLVVPNGAGALFGVLQLILFACYYKTTDWDDQEDTHEIQLPTTADRVESPSSLK